MELNTKLHLNYLPSSAEPQMALESRVGPHIPVSGLFLRERSDVFHRFHISVFHIGHWVVRFTSYSSSFSTGNLDSQVWGTLLKYSS